MSSAGPTRDAAADTAMGAGDEFAGHDLDGGRPSPASGTSGSGGNGSAGTSGADAASVSVFSGPGYEAWLALECDCTAENPCPLSCDGIEGLLIWDIDWQYAPFAMDPVCDVSLSPEGPCPEDKVRPVGQPANDVSTSSLCGFPIVSTFTQERSWRDTMLVRWFDAQYTQTGWDLTVRVGSQRPLVGRICGGVIAPECARDAPGACPDDQQPHLCRCPVPSSCEAPPCPNYTDCTQDEECISGRCYKGPEGPGTCAAALHCFNATLDGVESDIDCGGLACSSCKGGQRCNVGTDCQSQSCTAGVCDPISMCQDTVKSEYESDVDCGGKFCPPCADGAGCAEDTECASGSCTSRVCDAATP